MADGRILAAGGVQAYTNVYTSNAETFDPSTSVWTPVGSLPAPWAAYVTEPLADGRVLLAGGMTDVMAPSHITDRALIFDPVTNAWTETAHLNLRRTHARSALLQDGRVLIVGGSTPDGTNPSSAEIYTP